MEQLIFLFHFKKWIVKINGIIGLYFTLIETSCLFIRTDKLSPLKRIVVISLY